ncbi:MAG: hypothetical protein BECKG1743D_GA0114223_102252 [Candidatus Kentron sp. G]|nr:MAG: hypothetical protein BECKG1743D_GA0114223_102252 [Candidatus Kentron sp. G]
MQLPFGDRHGWANVGGRAPGANTRFAPTLPPNVGANLVFAHCARFALRSCLETRNLLRWRPNCVLASRRGQKLRRVVHYSPYFCPHRALQGHNRSATSLRCEFPNSFLGDFRAVCKSRLALPNCVENVLKMLIYSMVTPLFHPIIQWLIAPCYEARSGFCICLFCQRIYQLACSFAQLLTLQSGQPNEGISRFT